MEEKSGWQELLYWNYQDLEERYFSTTLGSDFSTKLKIPKKFVKYFGSELPDNMILTGRKGREWPVELRSWTSSSKDKVLFGSGWQRFVQEQALRAGDILVFRYDGDSRLHVLTFDHQSGCEKIKPIFTNNLYGNNPHLISHGLGAGSLGTKCSTPSEDEELDDQNENMEYSSDGWEDDEIKKKTMSERCIGTDVGSRDRGRGRGFRRGPRGGGVARRGRGVSSWRGRGRGRKTSHDEQEELAANSIIAPNDAATDSIETAQVQYSINRESGLRSLLENSAYTLILLSSRRDDVTEEERQRATASACAFESLKPFFSIMCMLPTLVTQRFVLTMLVDSFWDHLQQRTEWKIRLKVAGEERKWVVRYEPMRDRVGGQFTSGWSDFVFDNVIEEEDALVFELVKNEEDKVVFDVRIFRVVPEISPLKKLT